MDVNRRSILWQYLVTVCDSYESWVNIIDTFLSDGILNQGRKIVLRRYTEDVVKNLSTSNQNEAMKIAFQYIVQFT